MSIAQQFVDFLKEGKINEAIESIQGGLKDSTVEAIVEKRQELLESYGFSIQEKEDEESEEKDDEKEGDEKEEDDDDDDDDKSEDEEDEK